MALGASLEDIVSLIERMEVYSPATSSQEGLSKAFIQTRKYALIDICEASGRYNPNNPRIVVGLDSFPLNRIRNDRDITCARIRLDRIEKFTESLTLHGSYSLTYKETGEARERITRVWLLEKVELLLSQLSCTVCFVIKITC